MSDTRENAEQKRIQGEDARVAAAQPQRRKRIPLDGLERSILTVEGKDDNYHYCWVNDYKRNIKNYLDAGYEFVDHDVTVGDEKVNTSEVQDGRVSRAVGFDKQTQKPLIAFLMRIRRDWYEEDMAAYNKQLDDQEAIIKRGLNQHEDGQYGKVEISRRFKQY